MSTDYPAVCYLLHDDHWFLASSIASFGGPFRIIAFLSTKAWDGSEGDWRRCQRILEAAGAEIVLGEWLSEDEHRRNALDFLRTRGERHVLIPDGDEVIEPGLVDALLLVARSDLADRVYVEWDTYWKDTRHVVRPREQFRPLLMINAQAVEHVAGRHYEGGRPLLLGERHGIVHHLSYAGPDERIRRKTTTWGHKDELVPGWWEGVWLASDRCLLLRDLHPTHPPAYERVEVIETPEVLRAVPDYGRALPEVDLPDGWPSVSVVIPLYGGEEDVRLCLESLEALQDLLHEVIVVDNASPDGARDVVREFGFAYMVENEGNLGFARACNQGFAAATGEVVLFLNSDTVVPRAGLIRLIEPLAWRQDVAATGPLTNNCGHCQQIPVAYESIEAMPTFAKELAWKGGEDQETDMLVGFCLAVRRSAVEDGSPFDEQFGLGTFEDNDLCYRLRRAGHTLLIASRAFVHHGGSKTFQRERINAQRLLERNQRLFIDKWKDDLVFGFASALPGLGMGPVRFDEERRPEAVRERTDELAIQADISLCMIVRNEERVLDACLASAKPFMSQIIVVDTGSTDRTVEIARSHGAMVHEIEWPDSFAEARNESLRFATGKWVFWMDADDTLPWGAGEAILRAALSAPEEIAGFVVPVQFVEEGPGAGTRVDHVKLFRNYPDVRFEGRIHEQNLSSVRPHGEIARIEGAYVLHSGYDTSEEGQKKKRERDEKLLMLDLAERPDHPFVLFNLGMTAHYTGDHEDAIDWLRQSIEKAEEGESHVRKAYALLAVSQRELGRKEEAVETLLEGLRVVHEDPEIRFHLGLLLTGMERYEEAKAHYTAAPDSVGDHFSSLDVGILSFKRYHNLAAVCMALGEYEEAKEWWRKAMASAPHFLPSAFELFDTALQMKDTEGAHEAMEHVRRHEGPSESWAKMLERYGEVTEGPAAAEHLIRRACEDFPHASGPLLILSRRLLAQERVDEAIAPLDELQGMGVAEAAYFLGVTCIRAGRLDRALAWMEQAQELDPTHEQTAKQVENLRLALGAAS